MPGSTAAYEMLLTTVFLVQVVGNTLRQISSQLRNLDQHLTKVSSIRPLEGRLVITLDLLDNQSAQPAGPGDAEL